MHTRDHPGGRVTVRVVVVDDQAPFRRAARSCLRAMGGFHLVGEASSGEDAVALVHELCPDVVLMDVSMPGMGGIEAARSIAAAHPRTLTVLLSTYGREELSQDVERCGAAAYVHKSDFTGSVLRALWEQRS